MKKRWFCFALAFALICTCISPIQANAASSDNTDWIVTKMNEYIVAVSKVPTPHWNMGRLKGGDEKALKAAVDRRDYTYGLTSSCCTRHPVKGHNFNYIYNGVRGCESNKFGEAAQCIGFAKYFCYVLYGSYPNIGQVPSSKSGVSRAENFTFYARGASYPGLRPGDAIRYNYGGVPHAAIVYRIANGIIYVIDCNRGSDPCVVNLNKTLPKNDGNPLSEAEFKSLYANGAGYIARYNGALSTDNATSPGGETTNVAVSAVTTGADTITQTSAILRGSVSSTGAKMTQCGMLLGTTTQNMTRLGYDSINTYSTTCFYSTSKYGRTLTPGTTYYYQAYAVVDGKEYKGNVRSFRTTGTAPTTEPTLTATATTGTVTNITYDSALFSGSFSASSAVTLKQFGVLLGKTQSTMLKYPDTTKANLTTTSCSFQLSAANLGIKLEPNTTYYYCTYAFFGDAARMGEIRSFKTAAAPQNPVSHVSISLSQSNMTIQDNVCKNLSVTTTPANLAVTWKSSNPSVATVNNGAVTGLKAGTTTITASVSYNGQTASASCVVTVEASKEPCNHVKGKYLWYAAVHPHYDHYQCAICGETYRGTTTNIMPTCEICCPINAYGIRLSGLSATNITANSVKLNASCAYTGSRPTSVGVYLGTTPTNIQIKGSDGNINHNKNPFNIWYNLNGLTAGTTYYYRFYAVVDGKMSYSEIKSFTTSAAR